MLHILAMGAFLILIFGAALIRYKKITSKSNNSKHKLNKIIKVNPNNPNTEINNNSDHRLNTYENTTDIYLDGIVKIQDILDKKCILYNNIPYICINDNKYMIKKFATHIIITSINKNNLNISIINTIVNDVKDIYQIELYKDEIWLLTRITANEDINIKNDKITIIKINPILA